MINYCYNDDIEFSDLEKVLKLADDVFGANTDSEQYNPSVEEFFVFKKKFPFSLCVLKDDDLIIGFCTVVPCSNELRRNFLDENLSEPVLVKSAESEFDKPFFESLYLMTVYIDEKYRKKGIISIALGNMINFYKKKNNNLFLFTWSFSDAGLSLCKKLSETTNLNFEYLNKK